MLTRAVSRYKVNLAIPLRAGCACAILRAPQPIPASNLSEGSDVDVPVRFRPPESGISGAHTSTFENSSSSMKMSEFHKVRLCGKIFELWIALAASKDWQHFVSWEPQAVL